MGRWIVLISWMDRVDWMDGWMDGWGPLDIWLDG